MFALLACADTQTTSFRPGDPHVLLLVLDGVRVEELTSAATSDLSGVPGESFATRLWSDLAGEATIVRSVLNTGLPSTTPGHAMLLTGRNEPLFTVGVGEGDPGLYRPRLPTLFEEARRQYGWIRAEAVLTANTYMVAGSSHGVYPGYHGLGARWAPLSEPDAVADADDGAVFDALLARIEDNPPHILVANLHNADRGGHDGARELYLDRVLEQDERLADLWEKLGDYREGLLLVVTADHGRHRHEEDGGWWNHGDACTGCREVPLVLMGDGVRDGEVVEGDGVTLLDIGPTLAAWLGVELPWAEGLPLTSLVDVPAEARSGEGEVVAAGGHVATRAWLDDPLARSEVRVDGVAISTPGAFAAEAPALATGAAGTWACFREYTGIEEDGYWPWTARCLFDGGEGWTDIGFPDATVGSYWRPALAVDGPKLWAAWHHTPLTRGEVLGEDEVRLASWTPAAGWVETGRVVADLTGTDLTLAPTSSGFIVATANNVATTYGRLTTLWSFGADGAAPTGEPQRFDLHEILVEPRRAELPALRADGEHADLAVVAMDGARRLVAWLESEDAGATWEGPYPLPAEGEALLHVGPQWSGEHVVWAALLDDGTTGLCRVIPGEPDLACASTGSARLDSFAVTDGGALASVDAGVGEWEVREVGW